ncbi:carboxylesterase/lipase family protein [Microbulbifer sp. SSSA002]|uniref:carboxylesterase/lipase family protein n=1 Tax=unclassified Microbulbifer TaxID=2619833 RepID=UPI004039E05F
MTIGPKIKNALKSDSTPVVDTPAGPIIGTIDEDTGVYKFLGIPYAQPPSGNLRWLPPQKLERWKSPLQAHNFGSPAAQNPSTLIEVRDQSGNFPEKEECLYLNIFSPTTSQNNRLPVMLWIHGGSFYMGSGCQAIYNGRYLAASGRAIVVTINYRLGALGFLRLKDISDIPATGNEGLLDQIAALQWIQENISAFGGDPQNITLFGESAGAMSIVSLLEMPQYRGLIRRAIVQSGHPRASHSPKSANHFAQKFVYQFEQISHGASLKDCSAKLLLKTQKEILSNTTMAAKWGQLPFKPVADTELFPSNKNPNPSQNHPLLLGNNLEEWNLFSVINPEIFTISYREICTQLEWLIPESELTPLLKHYHQLAKTMAANPWPEWSRAWNLLLTDMVFTLPGLRYLQRHQGQAFHYHFAQPLAAQPLLGACHGIELGYVFGTHSDQSLQTLYGKEENPHLLSATMQQAWLSFSETGQPGRNWPEFSGKHSKRFGNHSSARAFDSAELLSLWQHIPDDRLNGYL